MPVIDASKENNNNAMETLNRVTSNPGKSRENIMSCPLRETRELSPARPIRPYLLQRYVTVRSDAVTYGRKVLVSQQQFVSENNMNYEHDSVTPTRKRLQRNKQETTKCTGNRLTCTSADWASCLCRTDSCDCKTKSSNVDEGTGNCPDFERVVNSGNNACECAPREGSSVSGDKGRTTVPSERTSTLFERRNCAVWKATHQLSVFSILTNLLIAGAIVRRRSVSTSFASRLRWLVTAVALIYVVFGCVLTQVAAENSPMYTKDSSSQAESGVCQSVDIRNSVSGFERLRGCRVVEGFVKISLIDHANETDYANLSYPELREITGYLLLFRVTGLQSLAKIFPNLSVIRGNTLYWNYALLSYEMMDLKELGLHSLTDILRGGVLLEKNPSLCFVDTIDWDLIVKHGEVGDHSFKGNKMKNECPMCPNASEMSCPMSSNTGPSVPLCWNSHTCQKVCPKNCSSCDANGHCCHESCLGGCTAPGLDNCYSCKNVMYGNKCIQKCPLGTYEYLKRRCVVEKQCYKMPVPRNDQTLPSNTTWKPFNNNKTSSCILVCPPGYEEKPDRNGLLRCVVCNGPCRKECSGGNVDSISAAQKLRGCTYIKGSLEIQIRGGANVLKELEYNLNMIEEIEGHLKIVRSHALISLNFLRNLRVIHGVEEFLEVKKYALYLFDNQNLQELWDWETHGESFQIKHGSIFFHLNPKLCLFKIKRLNQIAKLPNYTDQEVGSHSNGDKVPCNVTNLQVMVYKTAPTIVFIRWEKFEHYDPRMLMGYIIYLIEAPVDLPNSVLYSGPDVCGNDGWVVNDANADENEFLLAHLKPYTRYGFYVKTSMISNEDRGAQSQIKYFMTEPDIPSLPLAVKVHANSSTELVVKWKPPQHPNGNVTHYIITATKENDIHTFLGGRNYCDAPITGSSIDTKPLEPMPEEVEKTTANSCNCDGTVDKSVPQESQEQKMWAIEFENQLLNDIYIRRSKRSIDWNNHGNVHVMSDAAQPFSAINETGENIPRKIVYNATVVVMDKLQHYGQYTIRVQACRELSDEEKKNLTLQHKSCSITSIDSSRTLALKGANDISKLQIEMSNHSLGMVKLLWDEPLQPNGMIVTYQIEYRRWDIENNNPTTECITRQQYLEYHNSYTLKKLLPGNYSVHVRATSLAGNGEYTPNIFFLVQDPGLAAGLEWIIALVSLFFLLVVGVIVFVIRRKQTSGVPNMKLIASVNPEYMSTVYVPDEWEVPRKKIELLDELGQGSFGMVYEGIARNVLSGQPEIRCAIKTVGEHATDRERSEFLNEASVMKAFHTHHVVQLLGVVSEGQPVLVVMELMTHGDLKTYLRSHRPDNEGDASIQPPTLRRILQMAIEIADGMAYLAAKKFVHRDLAARNCMVSEDLTVKIGDFGMTRDIYETDYYRKGTKGLLPVRWMAPESLKDGVFTSRSDVWSYGVVLWEMATLASQPYQGLSNDQVLRYVIDGGVMERPENCPDRLYELMRLCWQHKPLVRLPFLELVSALLGDVGPEFQAVSFYHSKEGSELRAHLADVPAMAEDDPATPLRITRDIEDFSLGGSDEEDPFEVSGHSPSTSYPRFSSLATPPDQVVVTLPSNGNKLGNGSTATTPTTANGWIADHPNGTEITNSSLKTTEC